MQMGGTDANRYSLTGVMAPFVLVAGEGMSLRESPGVISGV